MRKLFGQKKSGTDKTLLRVEDTRENNNLHRHKILYRTINKMQN